ncbi:GNAT family N-acetyltransferase [Thermodesulfobacteriota bacterium]
MKSKITRDGQVTPKEIEDLRAVIGWDRCEGTYESILCKHFAYYIARADDYGLIGYVSVLCDGISNAFLLDLMVHPEYQKARLGIHLVRTAVKDLKQAGIRCVQVTFNDDLEPFYKQCGFHIFKGGIIDFKNMDWE